MASMQALLLLVVLTSALVQGFPSLFHSRLGRYGMMGTPSIDNETLPPVQWLQQPLDHFNEADGRTWQQRYWVNDLFWDSQKGPVFLMISGESEASPGWVVGGNMMINAQKYHALAVILEHRFYGESRPTSDLSLKNLVYLSSEQALADLATLHDAIVKQYNLSNGTKWVSFGGSYSGALSAWFRIKYPNLVVGAVASSAPVQAEYDFYQYLEVVDKSLQTADNGNYCVDAIKNATNTLDAMLVDPFYWEQVEELFNVRPPMQFIEDGKLLSQNLAVIFMTAVQYNQAKRADMDTDNAINKLCSVMTNTSLGSPLIRLVAVRDMYDSTLNVNFTAYLEELKNPSWSNSERQWFYQTCKEFAYFQVSNSHYQPFGKLITLDLFYLICHNVYGIDLFTVENNVRLTNEYYGGKNISSSVTNIVFPNGSIDPWHVLGVTVSLSSSLLAVYIIGTSHCADMDNPSPDDPVTLTRGRIAISNAIGSWLSQDKVVGTQRHQL